MQLSLLCVTRMQPYSLPFLEELRRLGVVLNAEVVLAADGPSAFNKLQFFFNQGTKNIQVSSQGYIESVLDVALDCCTGDYILRLDDDEIASPAMVQWLATDEYLKADHWKFPRMHLWPDETSMIMTPHLFPDHQTRLSIRAKSGGRSTVHAGSPFGGGEIAPVAILHLKFMVKSYQERQKIAEGYDRFQPGFGTGNMLPFSLPEDAYKSVDIVDPGTGRVPWTPRWSKTVEMGRVE